MAANKVINFSPGPAKVPEAVVKQAQDELVHYKNSGVSVMELSHRSATFQEIIETAEQDLRDVLSIPDNYKVLFLAGGGTGQFSSVPLNLCPKLKESKVDYMVTGTWSSKAAKEAAKYANVNLVFAKTDKHVEVPDKSTWKFSADAKYIYFCDNETVHGIEYPDFPELPAGVPVACDMTSDFLTKPVDVSKFGCIVAGTQKNAGIAGLAVVIVREDLITPMDVCPSILDFKVMAENKSLYNTPPCYPIYITGLCLKWIKASGGLEEMNKRAVARSQLLYNIIDSSNGFYVNSINPKYRSRLTVVFRVGGASGDEALEKKFVAEATALGMIQLKGHRSVGGIRASMFNAMTLEEVQSLANFMTKFQTANKS